MKLRRYWDTVRHLTPSQMIFRVRRRLLPATIPSMTEPPQLRRITKRWAIQPLREPSFVAPGRFTFHGESADLDVDQAWDAPGRSLLWRYHLHYFEHLHAVEDPGRPELAQLVDRWVAAAVPGNGPGWKAYPASCRVTNWAKWALRGGVLSLAARASLAQQAEWIARNLEFETRGNHLVANAKALVFAGVLLECQRAAQWLALGLRLLEQQLPEQILADGGHFERSPMYHSLVLEDLLDLVQLARLSPEQFPQATIEYWQELVPGMLGWLQLMTHPDGQIALFNDAVFGQALGPATLNDYAGVLGMAKGTQPSHLGTGYVRLESGNCAVLFDAGDIGPDYLPAHAHADTLSFELSYRGQRVIVDTGTSTYTAGPERQHERGTAAHNTITLDDADQSEVWGAFRVARRAHATLEALEHGGADQHVSASHDGYLRLSNPAIHRRTVRLNPTAFCLEDTVTGGGQHRASYALHLHPAFRWEVAPIESSGQGWQIVGGNGVLARLHVDGAVEAQVEQSHYCPRLGCPEPNSRLRLVWQTREQTRVRTELRFV